MSLISLWKKKKEIDENNQSDNEMIKMLELIGLSDSYDLTQKEFNLLYDLYNELKTEADYCSMIANNNDIDSNKTMIENYRLQAMINNSLAMKVLLYLKKYLIKRNYGVKNEEEPEALEWKV